MINNKMILLSASILLLFHFDARAQLSKIDITENQLHPFLNSRLDLFATRAYSTLPALYNSFKIAAFCIQNNIPGDFVECGVALGAQVAAMALAGQMSDAPRVIHLLDSFEGIPLAGPNDDQQPGIGTITHNTHVEDPNVLLVSSGVAAWSLDDVKTYMQYWQVDQTYLKYHVGWFQNVLPTVAPTIDQIAFLRLDGDLYESTKVCLEYLYPKVVKGGFVVIDDYSSLTGCRKAVDEYIAKHNLDVTIELVPQGGGPVYWRVN
jgi:O-methyltransferase